MSIHPLGPESLPFPHPESRGQSRERRAGPVPADVFAVGEHLAGVLHRFLADRGLDHWRVFGDGHPRLPAMDSFLVQLEEPAAKWESLPLLSKGGFRLADLGKDAKGIPTLFPSGVLLLPRWKVAVARWHWFNTGYGATADFYLYAGEGPESFDALLRRVCSLRMDKDRPEWQVIRGDQYGETIPRDESASWDTLILAPEVRQRLEREIGGFFTPATAALYQKLKLPHKRGILLWGPPGNGKTSIVRAAAASQPDVAALFLQPKPDFGDDDLAAVIAAWRDQAPAILVVEDLDWLLPRVSVSTFLNLLDGIDQRKGKGLLLIATTNHPDKLDPAVNNRPGRFDTVVEVIPPDLAMRQAYLARQLPEFGGPVHELLAKKTGGLSFAHLREIVLQSGHLALLAGQTERTEADVLQAATAVVDAHHAARGGFAAAGEPGFGLSGGVSR